MILPKISDGKSNFTIVAEDENHHMETVFYISLMKFPKEKKIKKKNTIYNNFRENKMHRHKLNKGEGITLK